MGCGHGHPNVAVRSCHNPDGRTFGWQREIVNLASCGQATDLFRKEFREPYIAVRRARYTVWPTARRGEPKFSEAPIHRHLINSIARTLSDVELAVDPFCDSGRRTSMRQNKFGQGAKRCDTSDSVSGMLGEPDVAIASAPDRS